MKATILQWEKKDEADQYGKQYECHTVSQGFGDFYIKLVIKKPVGEKEYTWFAITTLGIKSMAVGRCEHGSEKADLHEAKVDAEDWYFRNALLLIQFVLPMGLEIAVKDLAELQHAEEHTH